MTKRLDKKIHMQLTRVQPINFIHNLGLENRVMIINGSALGSKEYMDSDRAHMSSVQVRPIPSVTSQIDIFLLM